MLKFVIKYEMNRAGEPSRKLYRTRLWTQILVLYPPFDCIQTVWRCWSRPNQP